ncbi:MAG TPA: hypothetical protein VKV26_07950 [Dehalococcoidia bacterium]|nr:hypothetical protein [Dehalococcoidia bacterium]
MQLTPMAARLLAEVEAAQQALIQRQPVDESVRRAMQAVSEAIAAALGEITDEHLLASPSPEEWSMAEVVEHVAEHDRAYTELQRLGIEHYVEHGLDHALQLWKLRIEQRSGAGNAK